MLLSAEMYDPLCFHTFPGTFQSVRPQSTVHPRDTPLSVSTSSMSWRAVRCTVLPKNISAA